MKTVAIIPCYNEGNQIRNVVEATKKYVHEVIVVDDGSTDDTNKQAQSATYVLRHAINLGKGSAMKTGCEAAIRRGADAIIFIDGDGQHNAHDIPRFLSELAITDFVVGQRQYNGEMPLVFKFGNSVLNQLFTFLFHLEIEDTQCGFRALKTHAYSSIEWTSRGYAVETEMLANAGSAGVSCKEIPIQTIYLDALKGTTIVDGIAIGLNMIKWRLGW